MALIFIVSSRSQPPGPADPALDFIWKKSVHAMSYALLAALIRRAIAASSQATQWAFVLTLLYAISDEFHQSFVPGRTARATDVLIDMAGATISLGALWFRHRSIEETVRSLRGHHGPADDEPSA
jgi:VanZ family protein